MKMSDLRPINPPAYDEVSVKKLYQDALTMPNMPFFFPEAYAKGRQCDCKFFFDIWNTIHPDAVAAVMKHAHMQRFGLEADNVKDETITMTD